MATFPLARGGYMTWYGSEIEAVLVEKGRAVTENITKAAADHAQRNHPLWNVRDPSRNDPETEASVFHLPARVDGFVIKALWGAGGAAKYLEFGTVKMAARPWLRPAADATYKLARFAGAFGSTFGIPPPSH